VAIKGILGQPGTAMRPGAIVRIVAKCTLYRVATMHTKPPPERESKIQRSVMVRLRHRFGVRLFRRNVGAMQKGQRFIRFAAPGQSDLWGILPDGRHLEIETKRPGNKPTELQLAWLKSMEACEAVALWGDNCNDIERCVEAILQGGKVVWLDGCEFMIQMP
jgi:hypothetical protein